MSAVCSADSFPPSHSFVPIPKFDHLHVPSLLLLRTPFGNGVLDQLGYWALTTGTDTFELWPPTNLNLDSNYAQTKKLKILPRPWFKATGTIVVVVVMVPAVVNLEVG